MSIRTDIINTLSGNIYNIQTTNGYESDIKEIKIGALNSIKVNKYPSVALQLGNEKVEEEYEDGSELRDLDIYIYCFVSTTGINENITTNVEKLYEDIDKLIYCSSSISSTFHQTVLQIPEIKNFKIKEKTTIFDLNQTVKLCGVLFNMQYIKLLS